MVQIMEPSVPTHDRCVPPGTPGAAHHRGHSGPGFVTEDDPAVLTHRSPGWDTAGHVSVHHAAIASSSH